MADISTGKQRGIVPFVDETTGRLPDQYLPQGVIDLQGDLEQAVAYASASATNAASSASSASQSASSASTSASQASESASQASGFASTASQAATTATGAASNASASATAAQQSASDASLSASAAKASETNAASSASAAKVSETNAAASATAARQAVDGFGLEVGTTTTGDPGTDAAVEIQKTGTKYTANFTIPRGEAGPAGVNENVPLGSTSGVVAQATDAYPAPPRKVQVHGATSDANTVEPTKLIISGVNFADLSQAVRYKNRGALISSKTSSKIEYTGANSNSDTIFDLGITLPAGAYYINYGNNVSNIGVNIQDVANKLPTNGYWGLYYGNPDRITFDEPFNLFISPKAGSGVIDDFQISLTDSEYKEPIVSNVNIPSDISLAAGDTLTIDRDGTTQIVHAEGEPTVLDNVTLPELPAPTFNVYTVGGYVQPTVDVDYERDVNLVLQALEAKIAALQVADKTN